jgi:hypothetical protein
VKKKEKEEEIENSHRGAKNHTIGRERRGRKPHVRLEPRRRGPTRASRGWNPIKKKKKKKKIYLVKKKKKKK